MPQLKITLVRSTIGAIPKHRRIVEALGLRKLHSHTVLNDNKAIRGMIQKVRHLLLVEELSNEEV